MAPSASEIPPERAPTPTPSARTLFWASMGALAVAAVVLVTVVLPAEYGIDPLGTGDALGLVVLSDPSQVSAPTRTDGLFAQDFDYRFDQRSFDLEAGGFVEYKYRLEEGASMVYAWRTSNWVRSEMHSEPDGAPSGTAEFFEILEEALQANGSYVAPFAGIHGWYWLNETDGPVTVTIETVGFFDSAIEFREGVAPIAHDIPRGAPAELPVSGPGAELSADSPARPAETGATSPP